MFDRIREDILCVFDRDPAARNAFEILTTYPGLHAVLAHRLAHRLWRRDFKWPARVLSNIARLFTGIEMLFLLCMDLLFLLFFLYVVFVYALQIDRGIPHFAVTLLLGVVL